ncbi:hypothetical protein NE237_000931 [Protea cynaroides]|uniref:Uncharacterized protein n=1 Tax=Protea cynaroides TaxID=273540 RepID=A0A9Q0QXZ0_9MAGN|nr:hypothetical protein NE237_000931 [Protea cynaroides]
MTLWWSSTWPGIPIFRGTSRPKARLDYIEGFNRSLQHHSEAIIKEPRMAGDDTGSVERGGGVSEQCKASMHGEETKGSLTLRQGHVSDVAKLKEQFIDADKAREELKKTFMNEGLPMRKLSRNSIETRMRKRLQWVSAFKQLRSELSRNSMLGPTKRRW